MIAKLRTRSARDRRSAPASAFWELAALFFKLGVIGFGGPAAHIALFEDEVVRRRGWVSRQQFLDLLGATNLIPGPNSTEMAIHIGHERGGWPGLLVAGTCFIVPAATIVAGLAWAYVHFGTLPAAAGLLYGLKPVVIAIVLQALWRLAHSAVKTVELGVLAVGAAATNAVGGNELLVLLGAGFLAMTVAGVRRGGPWTMLFGGAAAPLAAVTAVPFSLGALFLFFTKVGAVLFGSGYVLLAFLRADLVVRWHWLSDAQLLDAIAVGQITPGPVFTTATFVGYVLGGLPGAVAATVGIFLPAFVFVAASRPLIPLLRGSPTAGAFLDGVTVASLALMAVVTWRLAGAAVVDVPTALLAGGAAIVLLSTSLTSSWLILAGVGVGIGKTLLHMWAR